MKAARVERQEQTESERKREIEDGGGGEPLTGMGPPASPPFLGDYAGTQSSAGRRAGAPGSPASRE